MSRSALCAVLVLVFLGCIACQKNVVLEFVSPPAQDYVHCEDPFIITYTANPTLPPNTAVQLSINKKAVGNIPPGEKVVVNEIPKGYHHLRLDLVDNAGTPLGPHAERNFWVQYLSPLLVKMEDGQEGWNFLGVAGELHRVCNRSVDAVRAYQIALRWNERDTDAAWQLGDMLYNSHKGRDDVAHRLFKKVITYAPPERKMPRAPVRPKVGPGEKYKASISIVCMTSHEFWGPSSIDAGGIGGSEEAVVFVSKELAKLGYWVEVYGLPTKKDEGVDKYGVWWLPWGSLEPHNSPTIVVTWRNPWAVRFYESADVHYLWLHDSLKDIQISRNMNTLLNGMFVLSKMEAARVPPYVSSEKVIVTANGLNEGYYVDGENIPERFIYASSPDRGLWQVLEMWAYISSKIPGATLDVYYGFTSNFDRIHGLKRKQEFMEKLKQPGVTFHGMVGQLTLAHAFAASGYWLYPTSFEETSCITAMKAQALGAIPITSRHPDSALNETCGIYDIGPPVPPGGKRIDSDTKWLRQWADSVVAAYNNRANHGAYRAKMMAWARKYFAWSGVAAQWDRRFEEDRSRL